MDVQPAAGGEFHEVLPGVKPNLGSTAEAPMTVQCRGST